METIVFWNIKENSSSELVPKQLESISSTETENQLEEILVKKPELLMDGLNLIGRQTKTGGGWLDLLGIDEEGSLVVFELKKGNLYREAITQIIDYASFISSLDLEGLNDLIRQQSERLGIEKVESFTDWYQENYNKAVIARQNPKMVLVGLGVDEDAKRMVEFLAKSELDISLITFHGFKRGEEIFLARKVEVAMELPSSRISLTREEKLENLIQSLTKLNMQDFFFEIADFFHKKLKSSDRRPRKYGFTFYIAFGGNSYAYLTLDFYPPTPNYIYINIYQNMVDIAIKEFGELRNELQEFIEETKSGVYFTITSHEDWKNCKDHFEVFCEGFNEKLNLLRQQQIEEELRMAKGEIQEDR